ncbi:MAG: hypothetical protein EBU82_03190 [Flavobacteriia bacterium]|nr:hypothetical protein [Flavobacteriia bacterium]
MEIQVNQKRFGSIEFGLFHKPKRTMLSYKQVIIHEFKKSWIFRIRNMPIVTVKDLKSGHTGGN